MVTLKQVEAQLEALHSNYKFWGRAEIVELQHILVPGERIEACLNGRYTGGFATFVATDQRLLIVDKKLFFLTVEDMRYDMISEVDFAAQLMSGTIQVCTPTKTLTFTSYKPQILRQLASYIQQRVMQVRHQYTESGQAHISNPVAHVLPVTQIHSAAVSATFAQQLGIQAVTGAEHDLAADGLPAPLRRNPYMNPPLMMRRRIGRFGSIGTITTP